MEGDVNGAGGGEKPGLDSLSVGGVVKHGVDLYQEWTGWSKIEAGRGKNPAWIWDGNRLRVKRGSEGARKAGVGLDGNGLGGKHGPAWVGKVVNSTLLIVSSSTKGN